MSDRRRAGFLLTPLLAILLAGCPQSTAHPAEDRSLATHTPELESPASVSDSLDVTLALPGRITHGEPVPITLRTENTSGTTVDLYLRGRTIAFDIFVIDEEGTVVWRRLEDEIIPGILRIETLEPGGVLEVEDVWDQHGSSGEPVPPGSYQVHGELLTEGEPLVTPPRILEIVPDSTSER